MEKSENKSEKYKKIEDFLKKNKKKIDIPEKNENFFSDNRARNLLYEEVLEALIKKSKEEKMYNLLNQEKLEKMADDLVDKLIYDVLHE